MRQTLSSYRLLLLLGLAVLAVLLAACSGQAQAQPLPVDSLDAASIQTPSLIGPVWQWHETQFNNDTELTVDDPTLYTVQFAEDGAVMVVADCNTAVGTFSAEESSLRIELGPTTMVMCEEGSLSQEFIDQLSFAASYVFDGDRLVINMQMDAGNIYFEQAPAATPTSEPEETPTEEPEATATPTSEPEATPTEEPEATATPKPEETPIPEPEPSPTPEPGDDMARFVGEYKAVLSPEKKGGAILLVTLNLNEDGSLLLEVADLGA
ncbi:MAG: META domain-containing protein, partial [Chloroflexi bacterium]|nr:META domain-containing protein [Chloroflexota bacterium]